MRDGFQDTTTDWSSTGNPAWSPLLMLGGSVVAAVMLIGTGLSMLGTEAELAPDASHAPFAQRLGEHLAGVQRSGEATTVASVAELESLQLASSEHR